MLLDHPIDPDFFASLLGRRGQEDDVPIERGALRGQLLHGRGRRGQHPLIVDRTATVQIRHATFLANRRREGRRVPLGGVGTDHVHVPHDEHRSLGRIHRAQSRDEVGPSVAGIEHMPLDPGNLREDRIEVARREHLITRRVLRVQGNELREMLQRGPLCQGTVEPGRRGGGHHVRRCSLRPHGLHGCDERAKQQRRHRTSRHTSTMPCAHYSSHPFRYTRVRY